MGDAEEFCNCYQNGYKYDCSAKGGFAGAVPAMKKDAAEDEKDG